MNWLRKVAFEECAAEAAGDMEEANASSSSDGGASRAVPHEPNSTECAVRASSGLFERLGIPPDLLRVREHFLPCSSLVLAVDEASLCTSKTVCRKIAHYF